MSEKFFNIPGSDGFWGATGPRQLVAKFGSPLYVYNEAVLRDRCREMRQLLSFPGFKAHYSAKANSNRELLRIIHREGLAADAMSPGEIYVLERAGFSPDEIFYIGNNVGVMEMEYAISHGISVSVDSLAQLRQYGRLNPGGKVAIRFNPGVGLGHHPKVVTAGRQSKFGITPEWIPEVQAILNEYDLHLNGINQHLGSLFLEEGVYLDGVSRLLAIASLFPGLEFVDLGGGFGIPYRKREGEPRLDLKLLSQSLERLLGKWLDRYGTEVAFQIEPGRYVVAESGVLLGTVHSVKESYGTKYVGTDLGFNVLLRPVLYDAYHELEVYDGTGFPKSSRCEKVTVVGNICESGDILARERNLPRMEPGDFIGVLDAGAYGYSMCSNYNNRLRPAEVLIRTDGTPVLIRRRETLADLSRLDEDLYDNSRQSEGDDPSEMRGADRRAIGR